LFARKHLDVVYEENLHSICSDRCFPAT